MFISGHFHVLGMRKTSKCISCFVIKKLKWHAETDLCIGHGLRPHAFRGLAQFLPMTTQHQLKIYETAQRHNFTIYLGSEIQMSTLDPYMSTVAAWQCNASGREKDAACKQSLWKWLQKRNEKDKRYIIDVQFSTDKKLATGQDRHRKAIFSVLDPTFGCFYYISRKQRLIVGTIC